jgi:hypothetical protein
MAKHKQEIIQYLMHEQKLPVSFSMLVMSLKVLIMLDF